MRERGIAFSALSAAAGMATVYLAFDAELEREVALKVLEIPDPGGQLAARMLREAGLLRVWSTPELCRSTMSAHCPMAVFYAMKCVKGQTLDQLSGATLNELLRVFQKICEAVAFAHAQGIIHRDLKPENVMTGAFGEVLVMDWGLAKVLRKTAIELPTMEHHPGAERCRRITER